MARGISDHSPIWVQMGRDEGQVGRIAPINPWYLRNPTIKQTITQAIESYFRENERSVGSAQRLWEVFKTVVRGQALSQITGAKREKNAELTKLEVEILQLEGEFLTAGEPDTGHKLRLKKEEYKTVVTDRAKMLHREKPGRIYELGD